MYAFFVEKPEVIPTIGLFGEFILTSVAFCLTESLRGGPHSRRPDLASEWPPLLRCF